MKSISLIVICSATLVLGCESYRDYAKGESVRAVNAAQTHNPEGFKGERAGLDATKAQIALDVYRKDVSKPQEVKRSITINDK